MARGRVLFFGRERAKKLIAVRAPDCTTPSRRRAPAGAHAGGAGDTECAKGAPVSAAAAAARAAPQLAPDFLCLARAPSTGPLGNAWGWCVAAIAAGARVAGVVEGPSEGSAFGGARGRLCRARFSEPLFLRDPRRWRRGGGANCVGCCVWVGRGPRLVWRLESARFGAGCARV